jgi:uncharacterized RDD family membrane protein YckC
MDYRYTIETPEQIEFAYDIAGIGSRFLAAIIDTALIVVLQIGLGFSFFLIGSQIEAAGADASSLLLAGWSLLSFVLFWGYYIMFEMLWSGQSPGKRAVRLRVVREGGRPITFAASAIRNLIRFVDFLPGFYGLGVLVMFIDRRARRLGDLAGGSLVVKDRGAVSLESLTKVAEPLPLELPATANLSLPNLHTVSDEDYDLVQDFLRRRNDLSRESRQRLGTQLANGLRSRLGLPAEGYGELFLETFAREYRIAHGNEENPPAQSAMG